MTKEQKIQFYQVIKEALQRAFPNLTESFLSEDEIDTKIAAAISTLKGGVDADHDTLKELADAIVANALDVTKLPTQAEVTNVITADTTAETIDIFGDGSEIAFYRFENNTNDEYGVYNGIGNVTFEQGLHGNCGYNGTEDRNDHFVLSVSGIDAISNTDRFTVNLWIKIPDISNHVTNSILNLFVATTGYTESNAGNMKRTINFDSRQGWKIRYLEVPSDGAIDFVEIFFGDYTPDDQWRMFTVSKDGANVTLYLDGVNVGSTTSAYIGKTGMNYITILSKGGSVHNNDLSAKAYIDNFRIFNRPLTVDEIQTIYNIEKP